jgi:hypothetical protein
VLVEAEKEKAECALPGEASVYQEIPDEIWTRATEEAEEAPAPDKQS